MERDGQDRGVTGSCNCCGACCSRTIEGKEYACEHLIRLKPIGEPNATLCAVHDSRYSGMPIKIRHEGESIDKFCNPDFPRDGDELPPTCSYKV